MIVAILRRVFKGVSTPRWLAWAFSLMSVVYLPGMEWAGAEMPRPTREGPTITPENQVGNLDGFYVFLGVSGAATRTEERWDSVVAGHSFLVTVSEKRPVSLLGLDLGLSHYGDRPGGRGWIGPVVGSRRLLGSLVGLSAGASAEWDRTDPLKWGAYGSIWWFAGVVPYATAGRHQRIGTFVEVGVRLTLPALRVGRRGLL